MHSTVSLLGILAPPLFVIDYKLTAARQASTKVKEGVDRLLERHDDRERREQHRALFDWLAPFNYGTQQSDFISRRQEGTGQ